MGLPNSPLRLLQLLQVLRLPPPLPLQSTSRMWTPQNDAAVARTLTALHF